MPDPRNPYLVLGVPYGASKDEAARAFARATRRLRRQPNATYQVEDLNWALHAIEQRIDEPASSIDDYRMPADAAVYEIPDGEGALNPPVQPLPRWTQPSEPAALDQLRRGVLRDVAAAIANGYRGRALPPIHYFEEGSR